MGPQRLPYLANSSRLAVVGLLALAASARAFAAPVPGRVSAPLLAPPPVPGAAAAPAETPGKHRTRITFKDALFVEKDILLRGAHAEARVAFTRPAGWKLSPETTLHIIHMHSGVLLPERSSLTVRAGRTSRSILLNAEQGSQRDIAIPLDPEGINAYNAVEFVADQHYTLDCEDPFYEGLWTQISNDSYIEFVYDLEPVFTDLAVLPYPYFDPLAYPPTVISIVLPNKPSAATLAALANVTGGISQEAGYRPVKIQFFDRLPAQAQGHLIVVGTPAENPDVRELLSSGAIAEPASGDGLVASVRLPGDPYHAALIISGGTPEGVQKAAAAFVDRNTRATFVGNSAVVQNYVQGPVAKLRDWPLYVPDRSRFTLQDIGYPVDGRTVRGVYSEHIQLDVKLQPDAQPVEEMQRFRLHYAYAAGLNLDLSTVEVQLNGASLKSVPLDKENGSDNEWLDVEVPWDIYGPFNRLELVFHMWPKKKRPCELVTDDHLWGTVFADSTFDLPKDYWLEVPDLSAVRYGGFPFTIRADMSETAIVLPDANDRGAIEAMVRLMTYLTKPFARQATRVTVYLGDQVPQDVLSSRHMIFISPREDGAIGQALRKRAVSMNGDGRLQLKNDARERLAAMQKGDSVTIEEISSPWSKDRVALIVQESGEGYMSALSSLNLGNTLPDQFSGSVAVLSSAEPGALNSLDVPGKTLLGRIPLARRLRHVFIVYRNLFVALATFGVLLLFIALRRLLHRRKERLAASTV